MIPWYDILTLCVSTKRGALRGGKSSHEKARFAPFEFKFTQLLKARSKKWELLRNELNWVGVKRYPRWYLELIPRPLALCAAFFQRLHVLTDLLTTTIIIYKDFQSIAPSPSIYMQHCLVVTQRFLTEAVCMKLEQNKGRKRNENSFQYRIIKAWLGN